MIAMHRCYKLGIDIFFFSGDQAQRLDFKFCQIKEAHEIGKLIFNIDAISVRC